jgi:hypothetical protein
LRERGLLSKSFGVHVHLRLTYKAREMLFLRQMRLTSCTLPSSGWWLQSGLHATYRKVLSLQGHA